MNVGNFWRYGMPGKGLYGQQDGISNTTRSSVIWTDCKWGVPTMFCWFYICAPSHCYEKANADTSRALQGGLTECKGQPRWISIKAYTSCWKFPGYSTDFKCVSYSFHLSADCMFINVLSIDLVLIYWTKALHYHRFFFLPLLCLLYTLRSPYLISGCNAEMHCKEGENRINKTLKSFRIENIPKELNLKIHYQKNPCIMLFLALNKGNKNSDFRAI